VCILAYVLWMCDIRVVSLCCGCLCACVAGVTDPQTPVSTGL
jgi:hypothetical protein